MNKEMHVYKMEFCSARKKMKLLFVEKWMKREHHARKSKPYAESPFKHTHANMCNRNIISQNFSYRDICGNKAIFIKSYSLQHHL